MYLKKIEITGFKSFPSKTVLDFKEGITTIVGPNGSGKSNISDAVRWVMGEMRPKALRAPGMQDVIFSGTQTKTPHNFAEVTVIIDNNKRELDIDFSEVSITRKLYRNGESEYYLNRTPCRMRDINELFMDTGLGKEGYSVVGQGKVDEIISGNTKDRRNFFEEACGISKYRHKKEEAQRKLAQTEENIVRLNDIIGELAVRLPSLKRSSQKALQYEEINNNLKDALIKKWCYNIKLCREKDIIFENDEKENREKTESLKNEIENIEENLNLLSKKRREADLLTEELYKREKDWEFNISTFLNQIRLYEQENERNIEEAQNLKNEKENDEKRLKKYQIIYEERNKKIDSLNDDKKRIEEEIKVFDEVLEEIREKEEEISEKTREIRKIEEEKTQLLIDKNTKEGNIKYLSDIEKNYEGYQKSVKEALNAVNKGYIKDIKVYGTLADIIKANKKNALAFDAVLSGSLQNIVVEDEEDAKKIIGYLKRNSLGRVTFLPRAVIKEQSYDFSDALKEKGVVGRAVDLLQFDNKFKGVVTSLLGKTIIADTYENARNISRKYNNEFRIVTLDGEVFRAGGAIVGGNILKQSGFMSKNASIEEMKEEITKTQKKINEKENEILDLRGKISILEKEASLKKEGLTELNEKKAYLNYVIRAIYDETESQRNLINEQEDYINMMKRKDEKIEELYEKNESLKEDIEFKKEQIKQAKVSLSGVGEESEKIKEEKEKIDSEIEEIRKTQKEKNEILVEHEKKQRDIINKIELNRSEIEENTSLMWEQYEMTYSQASETVDIDKIDIEEETKRANTLKNKIKNMGAVNTDSIKEYEEVNERFTFMTSQRDDLEKAKKDLNEIIDEMITIMKREFKEKFKLIDEKFKITFNELFGGGQANLRLTDPENILESPIEIEVQPPGKKLESISLLSGGEKAFTATALLFSVLSMNTLPFCIFDEVEAALDEVNVYRFADYLNKYKDKTQFILISHRRGTMECADTLYGVTMQEKGISKIVSLKVDDVVAE